MGQLVDECDVGMTSDDRVDVHLLERRPAVVDGGTRHDLQPFELSGCLPAAVRLDKADDDIRAALEPATTLSEHRECLPHPWSGPRKIEAFLVPSVKSDLFRRVEREVQLENVDTRLSEEAERAPSVCSCTRARTSARERLRSRATRTAWIRASAGEMWGSRPDPDDVTASTGTGVPAASPLACR